MGAREVFAPRPGNIYAIADYAALELHTIAQACLDLVGQSALAEALNAHIDPHTALAAEILKIPFDEAKARKKNTDDLVFYNARQAAKVCNFGFPVGLGYKNMVEYARKTYKVIITEGDAKELKQVWWTKWPEMRLYFDYVKNLPQGDDEKFIVDYPRSLQLRAGCSFTEACSTITQGLGAVAAKNAGWLICKACYVEKGSLLYGSRVVNFIHDEFIMEVRDDDQASDKAHELARLMCVGADAFLPDVPTEVEPLLTRVWSKIAKPVMKEGKLIPWEP